MDFSAVNCTIVIAIDVYILLSRIVFCKLTANVQLLTVCVCALTRREACAYRTGPLAVAGPVMMNGKCKKGRNETLTHNLAMVVCAFVFLQRPGWTLMQGTAILPCICASPNCPLHLMCSVLIL